MAEAVRVSFLGGLGEIGRNCAVLEQEGRLVVLDCGVMFPNAEMPGVDLVLPDFTFLRERADDVDGIVLTHGHEDHVGALGYLLRDVDARIYGSALTLGFARNRLDEAGLAQKAALIPVRDGERRRIGPFDVEFIPVTHSVPNGFAIAFHTAQGVVLHTGDFKLDLNPVDDRRTDLSRIGQIAATEGVRLLLSDSTNARARLHRQREHRRRVPSQDLPGTEGSSDRRRLLREPCAPHPAARRRRHRERSQGRAPGPLDAAERRARTRARRADDPGALVRRHRGHRRPQPAARSASSRPGPRASRCRPWP